MKKNIFGIFDWIVGFSDAGFGYGAIRRLFVRLSASSGQYFSIPQWAPTGDFEIRVWVVGKANGNAQHIFDADQDLRMKGQMTTGGTMNFLIGNGGSWRVNIFGSTSILDGKLHEVIFERVGNVYNIKVDGVIDATKTTSDGVITRVNYLCRRANNSQFWNDIIADVKLTGFNGDRLYKLDEDFSKTTTAVDSISGQNATAVNITESTGPYEFDDTVSPNTWTNTEPPFDVIEVVGT